jgi:hypothetical protein
VVSDHLTLANEKASTPMLILMFQFNKNKDTHKTVASFQLKFMEIMDIRDENYEAFNNAKKEHKLIIS